MKTSKKGVIIARPASGGQGRPRIVPARYSKRAVSRFVGRLLLVLLLVLDERAGDLEEVLDDFGIELRTRAADDLLDGISVRRGLPVRPFRGDRIIGVGDSHDPGPYGDLPAFQPVGVARPVVPLVMGPEDPGELLLAEAHFPGDLQGEFRDPG